MTTQKIKSGRMPGVEADNFVAPTGILFFNEDQGDLRLGDGITPGGIPLSFGGGGGGGNYTLPTASTTVKGGVKIDGTTISIANQVISVGTVPYTNISGTPTIPTNTNQLTNGAGYITSGALTGYATESYVTARGYITSSALTGYATESYVTSRGYLTVISWNDIQSKPTFATVATSGSYNDLINKPTIPSNTNQLTNGAGYITTDSLTGLATETYVTTRGYITSSALTNYALTSSIPTNTNQLTNGAGYITSAALTGYATENYVTTRGYLTSLSLDGLTDVNIVGTPSNGHVLKYDAALGHWAPAADLTGGGGGGGLSLTDLDAIIDNTPSGNGSFAYNDATGVFTYTPPDLSSYITAQFTFNVAADDSSLRTINSDETIKFIGAAGITTSSDSEGSITITGPNLSSYATETFVTTQGYLTTVDYSIITNTPAMFSGSYNDLTDKPNLAGTYSWSIAADDSTQIEISAGNLVKITGAQGITTTSNVDGVITITGPDLSSYATQSYVTTALSNAGVIISNTAPLDQVEGKLWYDSVGLSLYVRYNNMWVAASPSAGSGNYNDLINKPTDLSQFDNGPGYTTRDEVYAMILEMGR